MESILSRTKYGRAFLHSFMHGGPKPGPIRGFKDASEVKTIVRESPITVSIHEGQSICELCRTFQSSPSLALTSNKGGPVDHSSRIEYRDWAELDTLSEQGCSTCRVFRAAILYDHPSPDALELLALDDSIISVDINEKDGDIIGLVLYYPCNMSKADFNYDPEAPYGRPEELFKKPGASMPSNALEEEPLEEPPGEITQQAPKKPIEKAIETAVDEHASKTTTVKFLGKPAVESPEKTSKTELGLSAEGPIRPTRPGRKFKLVSTSWVDIPLTALPPHSSAIVVEDTPSVQPSHEDPNAGNDTENHITSNLEDQVMDNTLECILGDLLHSYQYYIDRGDSLDGRKIREYTAKSYAHQVGPKIWVPNPGFQEAANNTISTVPSDALIISKFIMWMGTCLICHPQCGLSDPDPYIPTRVIDLGDEKHPLNIARVIETKGNRIAYSCLSYCWGGDSNNYCRLVRSNIRQLHEAIFTQNVPKTVRDAMWISKALGVRYMWIDALCIIQDDILDWQAQSPHMGQIYSNAIVTIAATSSEHADMGIIRPRPAERNKLEPCKLFNKELSRPIPNTYTHLGSAPINRRAWTMQELYLSRRILHMTDTSVAWECRTHRGVEYLPEKDASPMFPYSKTKEIFRSGTEDKKTLYRAWQSLIMDYSSKQMTKQEDILVAVSGLADVVAAGTGDAYLAGLWKENIFYDLMWQSDESRHRRGVYTAPSWSWASTHGSGAGRTSIQFVDSRNAEFIVQINEVCVSYLDSNIRSQVLSGYLKITGKIAEAEAIFDGIWAAHGGEGFMISVNDFDEAIGEFTFDDRDLVTTTFSRDRMRTTSTQLYCVALAKQDVNDVESDNYALRQEWIKALVLEKVDETSAEDEIYRRVGFAHLERRKEKTEIFEALKPKCITIL
ncbi:heterokaryon incompatibility protein-domain-containing protein [Xylaria grammica]|nr:heterokaryon incompatibility protein-domain-containing protein [Xylaria grammica]